MRVVRDINILEDQDLLQQIMRWSVAIFVVTIATSVSAYVAEQLAWGDLGKSLLLAAIVSVAVLPVHELLHAAAFKLLGGPGIKVSFGAKDAFLYTRTNDAVLPRECFVAVLLTPAAVITVALLLWGCIGGDLGFGILTTGLHLSGCTGDLLMAALIHTTPEATHVQDTEVGCKLLAED